MGRIEARLLSPILLQLTAARDLQNAGSHALFYGEDFDLLAAFTINQIEIASPVA